MQEFSRFYAYGGGREFAMGAMYALYEGGLSAEEIAQAGGTCGSRVRRIDGTASD